MLIVAVFPFLLFFFDRCIPANVLRFASAAMIEGTADDVYRRYGLFRFPRTFLWFLSWCSFAFIVMLPVNEPLQISLLVFTLAGASLYAGFDAIKSLKGR